MRITDMMTLTVKENGIRVANPSYVGVIISSNKIRSHRNTLLVELGFKEVEGGSIWVHKSAHSLCVEWRENANFLSIQRGDFSKDHRVGGEYDLHDFVSEILQSLRDVWVGGTK